MASWRCGIDGCGARFESAERLVEHQARDHERGVCEVCGESFPAGFLAIRHAFSEHTRADYLRAYDADSDDIRTREDIVDAIEAEADVPSLLDSLGVEDRSKSAGD